MLSIHSADPFLIAASIALGACMIQDLRQRMIPNKWWPIIAAGLLPFRIHYEWQVETDWLGILAWGLGLTIASLILWLTKTWGGADAKGSIIFAWLLPVYDLGLVQVQPLLWALPPSLILVLVWQRIKPGGVPVYAVLSPTLALILWILR